MRNMSESGEKLGLFKRCYNSVRVRYRLFGVSMMLVILFTDNSSRLGIPLAMIGGMVKKNCSDPEDTGAFCWSEDMKATMVGAFFYGYVAQMVPTAIARRLGFTLMVRSYLLLAAAIQISYPFCVEVSVILAAALQVVRGIGAGIIMSNNIEFARKWGLGDDGKKFISAVGMVSPFGTGVGPMMAGLLTTRVGWKYYFYVVGSAYIIIFIILVVFVPDSPLEAWLMSDEEKSLFRVQLEKSSQTKGKQSQQTPFVQLLQRPYVWAFSVYWFCMVYTYYTEVVSSSFYLNRVHWATSDYISFLQLGLGMVQAATTYLFSRLFLALDKKIPWIKCRLAFCLGPMVVTAVVYIILPNVDNMIVSSGALVVNQFVKGTMYIGSIMTINYEMDPINAAMITGVFNGVGQLSGFLNPLVMAKLTR